MSVLSTIRVTCQINILVLFFFFPATEERFRYYCTTAGDPVGQEAVGGDAERPGRGRGIPCRATQ